MKKSKIKDTLEQQEAALELLNQQSMNAIQMFSAAATTLENVNAKIDTTMQEIDAYQKRLAETRVGLNATREKNQRIMQNFKNLLCVE